MDMIFGWLAVLTGAMMQGSFAAPQKSIRDWPWEKIWLSYCIFGMVVCPWVVVALFVPHAGAVYADAGSPIVLRTALFGAGWGIGSVLFGLGLAALGVALGFAIMMSLIAALGSLVPMAILHPDQLASRSGLMLIAGLVIVIGGVALCARAGALKDPKASAVEKRNLARGIVICVFSGVASASMSFAVAFGKPIEDSARKLGANFANAPIAVFALAMSAGFLINLGYCVYLLRRNRTWGKGLPEHRAGNLARTFVMGFLWFVGFYCFGAGQSLLGKLGPEFGWPVFMTLMVLVANAWGLATGEWKNADKRAFRYLGAGIALMVVALAVIAMGNR